MNSSRESRLTGLVAATHTPFDSSGALNLSIVEKQAEHLLRHDIHAAFTGGSTGESHSLAYEERRRLAERWLEVARGSELKVVVHVGSNSLAEARQLAEQAGVLGAHAISMLCPSYYKPPSLEALVACCAEVASAAPETPFYYYDIPALTGVHFSMPRFMELAAKALPNFAGLKYTNFDLGEFQLCRAVPGNYEVLWGVDEFYLAALALGANGGVGSTYNFAPRLAQEIEQGFKNGHLEAARSAQLRLVQLVQALARFGYLPAAKALMSMLGVDVGAARLPLQALTAGQASELRTELETLGYFDWI